MWVGVILAIVLIAVVVALSQTPKAKKQRQKRRRERAVDRLKRDYARLLHMPPKAARETVTRVMREMARDYPDRSAEWHLRKLISDLQRDRR